MRAESWSEVRIGDLGEVFTGRTPSSEYPAYFGDDFPFITPGDMRQGKHARTTERSLSAEGATLLKRITLPAQSICVSCIGWQMGEVIMTDRPSFTNQQINTIVPNDNVEPLFIYYSLRPRKQELLALGTMAGVRTPILNKSAFCDLKVQLPPLTVQQRIAGILSAYDELIENSQQRINTLELMARALYHEWFIHFRFPGHESIQLIPSSHGDIPEGWEVRKITDFADFTRGFEPGSNAYKSEPDNGLVKFLRVGDLSKRDSDIYVEEQLVQGRILKPTDIAISLDGSVGVVRIGMNGAYSSGIRRIDIKDPSRLGWVFAYQLLLSDRSQETIHAHAKGTTIKHAGSAVAALEFISPSATLIAKFEGIATPIVEQVLILQEQVRNLRATCDLILPRLLSGQIEVDAIAS